MDDNSKHTPLPGARQVPMSERGIVNLTQARGVEIARKVRLTRTAAYFDENLTWEEYVKVGEDLMQTTEASQWWNGDYLNMGERRYGEKYAHVVSEKSAGTLMNMASVASRFENSRRRENLSFAHHAVVAYLDPPIADALLDQAEENGMTRNQLREAAKNYRRALKNPDAEPPEPKKTVVKLTGPAQKEPPKLVEPQPTDEEAHAAAGTMTDEEAEKLYGKWEDVMVDPLVELQDMNGMLIEQLEALTVDDKDKKILQLHERIVAIEGRLRGETTAKNEAIKQAKYQGALLRKVRDLLGVERNQDIVSRLLALIQR